MASPNPAAAHRAVVFCCVAASALSGCGEGGAARDARPALFDGPAVELGTGIESYEPLVAEQALPFFEGIQGGYHFFLRARIRDLDPGMRGRPGLPGNPATTFSVFDEDGERVDEQPIGFRLGYGESGDGWYELPNERAVFLVMERISAIRDSRARIHVEVVDSEQRSAAAEVWVRPYEVPLEPLDAGVAGPTE